MPICNGAGNRALDAMFRASPRYLALMNGDPTTEGLLTQEMAGDGYVRKLCSFTNPSGQNVLTNEAVDWSDLPNTPIRYIAVCTMLTGGEVIAYKATGADIVVAEGYKFILGAGQLSFQLTPVT